MIRYFVGLLMLVCGLASAFAEGRPSTKADSKSASMQFKWRLEGPANSCRDKCRTWISAIGIITEDTVHDFDRFAKKKDVRGATLVLDSEGGSVLGALALGRAIRQRDMTTTVGRTVAAGAGPDGKPRAFLSPDANCESMCAFLLLAGVRRFVPPQAHVLVHQIWLGNKAKHALDASYSAQELRIVQRDIGSLARYTVEMGGDIDLLETALQVPPWQPMHMLTSEELRRMRLVTVDTLFEPEKSAPAVVTTKPKTYATAGQRRD